MFHSKALKALCQMILHPAHYITQMDENIQYIYVLEDARINALKLTERTFHNDHILNALKEEPLFPYPNERKKRVGPKYPLGYNETFALELAFLVAIHYKLDIKACIPPLLSVFLGKPPNFKDMGVPEGGDYIFDGDWEGPGAELNLEDELRPYRHRV